MSKREPIEIFNLAFLDIISCAFGAVVMLILLAKNGDDGEFQDANQISTLIQAMTQAQSSINQLEGALSDKLDQLKQAQASSANNADQADALETEVARAKENVQQLTDQEEGLVKTIESLDNASTQEGDAETHDEEVGGIPVDSEYVIFIIDTSGSMGRFWDKVIQTMSNILSTHPKVQGFQVMSDNGVLLGGTPMGQWRSDSPGQRRGVLQAMRKWNASSSSSPIEGISKALKAYGKSSRGSLALYVFGDDFNGASFDGAVKEINQLNRDRNGNKIARIHGVGFKPANFSLSGDSFKYATFMREVARQNNGAFLSL